MKKLLIALLLIGTIFAYNPFFTGVKLFFVDIIGSDELKVQARLETIEEINEERIMTQETKRLTELEQEENKYQLQVQERIQNIESLEVKQQIQTRLQEHEQNMKQILERATVQTRDAVQESVQTTTRNRERVQEMKINLLNTFSEINNLPFNAEDKCEDIGGTIVKTSDNIGCYNTTSVIFIEHVRNYGLYDMAEERCKSAGAEIILDTHNIGCKYS